MNARLLPLAAAALALSACALHRIPGTDINDTADSRAILAVMEQYRSGMEARDAGRILALVSESFKDDSGTPTNPEDDLDYAGLKVKLAEEMARVEDMKLDITVRQISVEKDIANAVYTYDSHFRMPTLSSHPKSEGGIKQMWFKNDGGKWKILSGM